MENGTWTIDPCPRRRTCARSPTSSASRDVTALSARAARLRRPGRGARVPRRRAARARPVRPRRHARGRRDDRRRGRGAARASASTATTTPTASARPRSPCCSCASSAPTPTWHLPSRFEEGYGLARQTLARLADDGCRPRAHRRLRDHGRRRGRGGDARSGSRSSSPTTTGPARGIPRLPRRRAAEGRLSVRGALRDRRRLEARRGAARAGAPVPRSAPRRRRARDGRRRRAARRREPRARAARPAAARADAEARAARADARRAASIPRPSTRARSASGSRRGSTRPAASAAPRRRSSCCSPRTGARRRCSPSELEELNRERQAVEERILRAAVDRDRVVARGAAAARGYVVAGEDWHEGVIGIVASRLVERYGRPGRADRRRGRRLEGLGPLDRRRSTCTAASPRARRTSSASAGTARPRGSRSGPSASRRSPLRSPPTPTRRSPTPICARGRGRRDRPRVASSGSTCARSSGGSRRSGSGTRA